jgi:hypothetical protein
VFLPQEGERVVEAVMYRYFLTAIANRIHCSKEKRKEKRKHGKVG